MSRRKKKRDRIKNIKVAKTSAWAFVLFGGGVAVAVLGFATLPSFFHEDYFPFIAIPCLLVGTLMAWLGLGSMAPKGAKKKK